MRRTEKLSPHALMDRIKELKRIARRLGVEQTGWEINIPSDRMVRKPRFFEVEPEATALRDAN